MEFILNNRKYSIVNHELFINYLMVDNYFREGFSKYDYDIKFDFITPILSKEKVVFEDILEGTQVLEGLLERQEVNFIPSGLSIDPQSDSRFKISYQNLEISNVYVGEAIPLVIALSTLLSYKPTLSLSQIEEELENFLEKFRSYARDDSTIPKES